MKQVNEIIKSETRTISNQGEWNNIKKVPKHHLRKT